ncbi:hypothetical protein AOX55_00002783 [Sinorhizobium fredii CCBAU 25509]|nr:hypothetical protein AOX55_00002783 [Sinorhizobium fredii CCBAU 25509]
MQGRHGVPHVVSTLVPKEACASCAPNALAKPKKSERDLGRRRATPLSSSRSGGGRSCRPFPDSTPAPWEPHLI